jgi:hypothetical protein
MDLVNKLFKLIDELNQTIDLLAKSGEEYASAYTNYRIALAQKLVVLKDEGYAITLASDIARGDRNIAHLKFLEISKEAIYKANLERINALKLHIKIISNQIDKEWGNAN